jgi:protein-S-isoprenylcysteine O-methyltransferase Ste14
VAIVPFAAAGIALVAFTVSYRWGSRAFASTGVLSPSAFASLFVAYLAMTTAVVLATFMSPWTVSVPAVAAFAVGGALVGFGLVTYVAARLQMRSFRATWGLRVDELVTTGPYRFSRNPQVLGAIAILVGASVMSRSPAALLLVLVYGWMSGRWIRLEETVLRRHFGAVYDRYCEHVARML